jgi:hypothetical protein
METDFIIKVTKFMQELRGTLWVVKEKANEGSRNFGNAYVIFERDGVEIRFTQDRGQVFVEVKNKNSDEWWDLLHVCSLAGYPPPDSTLSSNLLSLTSSFAWIEGNLKKSENLLKIARKNYREKHSLNMNAQKRNGWEKLICPYFAVTCRRMLGRYLEENGFAEKGLNEVGGLVYSRFGIFLEISYELEMVPYCITVALGMGDKKYDKKRYPCYVPYWYLLPREYPEHQAGSARFKNEAELGVLLTRFRDKFLEPYVKPFWLDSGALQREIERFNKEIEEKHFVFEQERKRNFIRQNLEIFWRSKDYAKVIEFLKPLRNELLPIELRKLEYAEKHLMKSQITSNEL